MLGVTARGKDLEEAIERAYSGALMINWGDLDRSLVHYRSDIGMKGLNRLK